jgi:hypothetical protein
VQEFTAHAFLACSKFQLKAVYKGASPYRLFSSLPLAICHHPSLGLRNLGLTSLTTKYLLSPTQTLLFLAYLVLGAHLTFYCIGLVEDWSMSSFDIKIVVLVVVRMSILLTIGLKVGPNLKAFPVFD